MKKVNFLMGIVFGLMLIMFTGCGSDSDPDLESDSTPVIEVFSFEATVLEVYDTLVIVRTVEGAGLDRESRVAFGTIELEDIGVSVGDVVNVEFTGDILLTYPEQIFATSWSLVSRANISLPENVEGADAVPRPPVSRPLRSQPSLLNAVRMGVNFAIEGTSYISVSVFNGSAYDIRISASFIIEFFNGDDWQKVPWRGTFTGAFACDGVALSPDTSFVFAKDLSLAEPLDEGLYRVRKHVFRTVGVPVREENMHDIVAEFRVGPHSLDIIPVQGICLECGDHQAGTHPLQNFRATEWAHYVLPLSIRDIYIDGIVEYYLVPLDDFMGGMNAVHEVVFDQWAENQWDYAAWPMFPNILIQTYDTVYDFAFVHIELEEDSEGAPVYVVQSRIFELDALHPGDAVVMSVRFVHYLIPRGAIMFTDSDGNRHRRLIRDGSPRGGCWPHWWLSMHADDDWAGWVD